MEKKSEVVEKRTSYGWGVRHIQMACMCSCVTVLFMSRSSMGIAVLAMTEGRNSTNVPVYNWDKITQGVVLSSFFWGYLVMQIPGGLLSKRFGGKPVILASLIINGVICLTMPLMAKLGGWPLVCTARVLMGLTQACLFPTTHTLLGRWLPASERTTYSGIVYGGYQIGTIISMPISGLLADTALGWTMIFYFCSTVLFICAGFWWWLAASSPGEHWMMSREEQAYIESGLTNTVSYRSLSTPWKQIFMSREMWAIVVAHIGCTVYIMFFFIDLPTYLEKGLKISLRDSASLSAVPYVGMWFGSVTATKLSDFLVNRGYISLTVARKLFNSIASFGVAALLLVMFFIDSDSKALAVGTLVVCLAVGGFIFAGFMVNHLDLSPNFAGVLLSLTNTAANLGGIGTPLIISYLLQNDPTDMARWRLVFLVIAGFSVVSNIVYIVFANSDRKPWDDPLYMEKKSCDAEEMKPVMKAAAS